MEGHAPSVTPPTTGNKASPVNLSEMPPELSSMASYPFPLDAKVNGKLRAKIISREFVNFGDLLDPGKAERRTLALDPQGEGDTFVVKEASQVFL